jgi:hypothetical protein
MYMRAHTRTQDVSCFLLTRQLVGTPAATDPVNGNGAGGRARGGGSSGAGSDVNAGPESRLFLPLPPVDLNEAAFRLLDTSHWHLLQHLVRRFRTLHNSITFVNSTPQARVHACFARALKTRKPHSRFFFVFALSALAIDLCSPVLNAMRLLFVRFVQPACAMSLNLPPFKFPRPVFCRACVCRLPLLLLIPWPPGHAYTHTRRAVALR